jgi:hypothetical protein
MDGKARAAHHRRRTEIRDYTGCVKWLLTTFLALLVLSALMPWLQRLGIGRLPGDVRLRIRGREVLFPFASTVVLSLALMLLARLL